MGNRLRWIEEGPNEDGRCRADGDNCRVYQVYPMTGKGEARWLAGLSLTDGNATVARGWARTLDEAKRIAAGWERVLRKHEMPQVVELWAKSTDGH